MRRGWMKKGIVFYYVIAFLFVFVMQALFSIFVNASALWISVYSTKNSHLN